MNKTIGLNAIHMGSFAGEAGAIPSKS